MRYFLDVTYIEGNFRNPFQLISLALVSEDGREYYAQSAEANRRFANGFVRQHILPRLDACPANYDPAVHSWYVPPCAPTCPWKQNMLIGQEIETFIAAGESPPEFWGYCVSHAWVVLCLLFGGLRSLPAAWPSYCCDLRQWLDQLSDPAKKPSVQLSYHALEAARSYAALWHTLNALDTAHTTTKRQR